ncbi:hypothetical protein IM792_20475 [Mucilaginibacter sp. JRF]|nr:hypothetical protein [Mucilaginibacter sp. JRF]MBE9586836.1 hypothetical protein [Mucilaginibacter sp. JRF]
MILRYAIKALAIVTDSWIFADSLKRKIYEYQPDGTLVQVSLLVNGKGK